MALGALVTNERAAAQGGVDRPLIVTRGCRSVRSTQMVRHGVLGTVEVSADGGTVSWDGSPLGCPPVSTVPLSRLHYW